MNTLLAGKNGLILGVANKRSIAWGIARAAASAGARLALTYQGDRLEEKVRELASTLEQPLVLPCDVTKDDEIDALFAELKKEFGRLDFIVHSVAYAPREALEVAYVETPRQGYAVTQDISAYSLVALAKRARDLMTEGGSIMTMTYYGGEKVVPGYNVMGVAKAALECTARYLAWELGPEGTRVNIISGGYLRTLASSAVGGAEAMIEQASQKAPLRRPVEGGDVGRTAVYLASDLSSGVTGETIYVDCGVNTVGI